MMKTEELLNAENVIDFIEKSINAKYEEILDNFTRRGLDDMTCKFYAAMGTTGYLQQVLYETVEELRRVKK